ncbi:MAG: ABC transporter substrate-binding protein, partial [Actinomycetota bacterium]
MRPQARFLTLAATASVTAALLAACGSSGGTSPSSSPSSSAGSGGSGGSGGSKPPILIGASLSQTGDFSADGQAFQRGYELWASDVNRHGGLLGRQVKLTFLDDKSDPTQGSTNVQQLISSDHVNM